MEKLIDLNGVGEKTLQNLLKLGIMLPSDLLSYYPKDYEEFTSPTFIINLKKKEIATIKGIIKTNPSIYRKGKLTIVSCEIFDGSGSIKAVWFNIPYIVKYLEKGKNLIFRGYIYDNGKKFSLNQPKIYTEENYSKIENKLIPIYQLSKGITNNLFRKLVENVLKENNIVDYIPKDIRLKRNLPEIDFALNNIHFPKNNNDLVLARKRLVYDELFLFSLGIEYFKSNETNVGISELKNVDVKLIDNIINNLPFKLTKSQIEAINDIISDLKKVKLINRLIEGDVGSGKTIVVMLIMFYVAFAKHQSALMAPTEVLAIQHYENINKLIVDNNLPFKACLLTASLKAKERKNILDKLKNGEYDFAIGTHALFSKDVEFKKLSFVITDEQHRFGVNQRKELENKSKKLNTIVMSATPIPRTLALLLYADLDISLIKEKPSNRLPIKNLVIHEDDRNKAYASIKRQINEGHQAYVICAKIDSNEEDKFGKMGNLQNVIDYTDKLKKYFGKDIRIEYLHGKMPNDKKEKIMTEFKNGEIDILVSTTVIEVGIDCKNATFIMIEDAERFGLATLHQLRGRVGRGEYQSFAVFVNVSESENSKDRLNVLEKSNDGFYIAEYDLKLRGPGDIFGIKQSGSMNFKIANIYTDANILKETVIDVKQLLRDDRNLIKPQNKLIRLKLDEYIKNGYTI